MQIDEVVPGLAIYNILVPDSPHLYFVASDRNEYDEVVWLMFSSFDDYAEKTCVVEPSEYSWLKRRSVVAYRYSEIQTARWICGLVDDKFGIVQEPIPTALLRRAQRDGLESKRLARRMKSMIRDSMR